MELPAQLAAAVKAALEASSLADLQQAADRLTQRYRAETRDGRLHLDSARSALGYIAARLPATYAAVRQSLAWSSEMMPGFQPRSLLDIGAGPGTALWAAADCWPDLESALLLDASPAIRALGENLAGGLPIRQEWAGVDIASSPLSAGLAADLVTICYVLDELDGLQRDRLVAQAWAAARGLLLIVEPGTPAGWQRILAARAILIETGATIAAPCPHHEACPLIQPDWCHFARRVARSVVHRQVKRGDVPWEDEKFIYLAASRLPVERVAARIIAPVRTGSGKAFLKSCQANGEAAETLVTKRDGEAFKIARRAEWGEGI